MVEVIICLSLLSLLLVRRKVAILVESIICLSLLSLLLVRRKICVSTGQAPSFIYQGRAFITYRRLFPESCRHTFGIGNIDHRHRHNTLNG